MKKTLLFIVTTTMFLATTNTISAQGSHHPHSKSYNPTIYSISTGGNHDENNEESMRQDVISDHLDTHRHGFQQTNNPQFIFATRNNRFSLAVGGYVNLRTSYDFKGTVNNIDFVTYDIPASTTYADKQRVMMDATTSRLYLKAIVNSSRLGRIVVYTDMDFRGGDEFSYIPRLRSAYVKVGGFTVGRDVSTFCDLNAAPRTVDFQGPNAYNFKFTEMIRYEVDFARKHWTFGIAAEVPKVNGTYNDNFSPIMQRVPDGIAYLQYAWGSDRKSHLRASGVVRDMYLHNNLTGNNTTRLGWGVQLSGNIALGRWVDLYMNGVYGEGITPYIQDLTGSPYDIAYNPSNPEQTQTMPMWSWQAAAQVNFIPGVLWAAGGYSEVNLEKKNGYLADDQYCKGQYIFGNIFCNITPNFTLALEYLRGARENMNEKKNTANRVSLMVQYNF